jgi:hypothetical protein
LRLQNRPLFLRLSIDLSTFDASNLEAIQIIASNDDRSENLNFTVQDVINLTDEDNILRILGGDDADLVTSSGEGWVQGGTTVINSPLYGRDGLFDITFDIYTHGSGATLLVDTFTPTDIS